MKKRITALLLAVLALFALAACGTSSDADTTPPADSATPTAAVSVKPASDRGGNAITVPETITKVISLAPATTQVIEDLGLLSTLVAVDTQSPLYVNGVDGLPQYDLMTPDSEAMLVLAPDIVFVSGMSLVEADDPFKPLRDMGICVAVIPSSDSIAGIEDDIRFIADCLGKSDAGEVIAASMRADIDAIAKIGATISEKKTVLFEISAAPYIYSFGSGVFLHEMLDLIGAENVFADQVSWIPVTEESAILANPDVVLTNVNYIDDSVGEVLSRTGWGEVTAVKNGAVYYIDNGASSLPNQHIVTALKQMAKAVYPDAYAGL
ncbi:MAG: ABC transporter substrate-binding protein [Oscillospiraceae bacterium]|jgi:iron complex transport system substrate-binding protein|nr:ABC transporter substrate-binding protein [Oscillospiraceae bacterium]